MSFYVMTRTSKYKDNAGQRIDFKEPYFDTALRRTFSSAKEKYEFMKAHNIVNTGESEEHAIKNNIKILEEIEENKSKERKNGKA